MVDHEDLVFYANLETRVIPRTKLAVGEGFGSPVTNTLIASIQGEADPFDKINFLQPVTSSKLLSIAMKVNLNKVCVIG